MARYAVAVLALSFALPLTVGARSAGAGSLPESEPDLASAGRIPVR